MRRFRLRGFWSTLAGLVLGLAIWTGAGIAVVAGLQRFAGLDINHFPPNPNYIRFIMFFGMVGAVLAFGIPLLIAVLAPNPIATIMFLIVGMEVLASSAAFLFVFLIPFLEVFLPFISDGVASWGLAVPYNVALSVASLALAYFAFYLKRVRRRVFGHFEVLFGVIAMLYAVWHNWQHIEQLGVPFFAGMYIIVRGFSNIEESFPKPDQPLTLNRYLDSAWWDFLAAPFFVRE
jgi:hypothetical protein